jgi:hypothetical protein
LFGETVVVVVRMCGHAGGVLVVVGAPVSVNGFDVSADECLPAAEAGMHTTWPLTDAIFG